MALRPGLRGSEKLAAAGRALAHTTAVFCVIACVLRDGFQGADRTPTQFSEGAPQSPGGVNPARPTESTKAGRIPLSAWLFGNDGMSKARKTIVPHRETSHATAWSARRRRTHRDLARTRHSDDVRLTRRGALRARRIAAQSCAMPRHDYLSSIPFAFKAKAKLVTKPWFLAGIG